MRDRKGSPVQGGSGHQANRVQGPKPSDRWSEGPIGLCYLDLELRYVHINEWLAAINGLAVSEHLGRTIDDVLPDVAGGVEDQLRRVISTGEPIEAGTVVLESPAHPGIMRTFQHDFYPVRSLDGTVVGVSCAVQEVTEREAAKEALHWYSMITASSDSMAFVDSTYTYRAVNQAYCDEHRRTQEEILGHTIAEVFGEEGFETTLKPHFDRCLSGEQVTLQLWWDSPGRGRRHVEARCDPFFETDGSVSGVVVNAVAISGIPGRLATVTAAGIAASDDLDLVALYNPNRGGDAFNGISISANHDEIECDVVFESTEPTVVMGNLRAWRKAGLHVVVGTSGFTRERLDEVRSFWGEDGPGCLIAPNFSIGAVLMMRFAELAAPHFMGIEVVERHHHDKPDAPSGTAIATAARIAAAGGSSHEESSELVAGSRGAKVEGVRVHSLRLDATLSNQEVALSKSGELLSIHHVSTEYASFADGALLAIRYVADTKGVTVGLDAAIEAAAP